MTPEESEKCTGNFIILSTKDAFLNLKSEISNETVREIDSLPCLGEGSLNPHIFFNTIFLEPRLPAPYKDFNTAGFINLFTLIIDICKSITPQ